MNFFALKNNKNAIVPEIAGDTTQLAAMVPTLFHDTASKPIEIITKPTIEPTIEWVVDTGQPLVLAIKSHVPAAHSADSIPIIKILSLPTYRSGSTIPFLIVEVTSPPAKYAPRNSKTAAIKIACLKVIALLPTDVPIALATSFAPIPNAMKKPAKAAIINSNVGSINKFSIIKIYPMSLLVAIRQ